MATTPLLSVAEYLLIPRSSDCEYRDGVIPLLEVMEE
jgi:hypothetical protein